MSRQESRLIIERAPRVLLLCAIMASTGCYKGLDQSDGDGSGSGSGGSGGSGGDEPGDDVLDEPGEGRLPRRMSVDQIRAAYEGMTGFAYEGVAVVRDPASPLGYTEREDADLLDVFGNVLGRPDYAYTVKENLEPTVSFSKLVGDASRSTCGRAAQAEVVDGQAPGGQPRLLLRATATDALPGQESAIRDNIEALVLRAWGHDAEPDDVDALLGVFEAASSGASEPGGPQQGSGTVADGWRAVCIALTTDPEFYIY